MEDCDAVAYLCEPYVEEAAIGVADCVVGCDFTLVGEGVGDRNGEKENAEFLVSGWVGEDVEGEGKG